MSNILQLVRCLSFQNGAGSRISSILVKRRGHLSQNDEILKDYCWTDLVNYGQMAWARPESASSPNICTISAGRRLTRSLPTTRHLVVYSSSLAFL
ncbi:hypothetical protein AVEN_93745-1 [Araneus ventricosus]|uniref:Uncharacterized protein n=1 Tax=Araneus ventricosus TaxID=182803 RepID=A0A4Y2J6D2_ARAVE|nr:hypothetical protein AVEN_93745-1 [Araneus ventricosus]